MESLETLKAKAYDCLVIIEREQIKLREINKKISEYSAQ